MSSIVPHAVSARLRLILLALVIMVALLPVAADAWGPYDGSYQLNLTTAGVSYLVYLVVLQDGANIGVVFLAPYCSDPTIACQSPTWNYGQGLPTGQPGQYQGDTQAANGNVVGSFNFQFSGDSVTGTTTTFGYPDSSGSGTRFWGGNPSQ
jgi:hypothetical protein